MTWLLACMVPSGDSIDEILKGKWGKLDGPHKVIESGHWPMITKPEELAQDFLSLVSVVMT